MNSKLLAIKNEVKKVIIGKDEIIDKVLLVLLSDGHILLDDIPGVGKTTLVLALSKSLDLSFKRVQFTPDLMPSDITGFTYYNKQTDSFEYMKGALNDTNILLCDEINRTSGKTQAALLEAMEERQVSVDSKTYKLEEPFMVIATENQVGTIGTQPLPFAELDRFLMRFSLGYPNPMSEIQLLKDRKNENPLDEVKKVASIKDILAMRKEIKDVIVNDNIYSYITNLANATRTNDLIELGLSPRGSLCLLKAAMAYAYLNERDYVIPSDVRNVFIDVCAHRIIVSSSAKANKMDEVTVLEKLLKEVRIPDDQK